MTKGICFNFLLYSLHLHEKRYIGGTDTCTKQVVWFFSHNRNVIFYTLLLLLYSLNARYRQLVFRNSGSILQFFFFGYECPQMNDNLKRKWLIINLPLSL